MAGCASTSGCIALDQTKGLPMEIGMCIAWALMITLYAKRKFGR